MSLVTPNLQVHSSPRFKTRKIWFRKHLNSLYPPQNLEAPLKACCPLGQSPCWPPEKLQCTKLTRCVSPASYESCVSTLMLLPTLYLETGFLSWCLDIQFPPYIMYFSISITGLLLWRPFWISVVIVFSNLFLEQRLYLYPKGSSLQRLWTSGKLDLTRTLTAMKSCV